MNKKVQASTLMEVVVSMIIIVIVFTMAIGIYARIINSSFSEARQKAQIRSRSMIQESISRSDWKNSSVIIDSLEYRRSANAFGPYNDLLEIKVEVIEQGASKGIYRQVIQKNDEEN